MANAKKKPAAKKSVAKKKPAAKKQPAAKKPAAKPAKDEAPVEGIPFPFFGAGDASYFEWAEIHLCFARDPKPAERTKIAKTVPPPIGDVRWHGRLCHASSDQGVGRVIQASYGKKKTVPTQLTTTSRFKMPDSGKLSAFNADTERWVLEANEIVPILAVFRRQDWEAGGTRLSAWHDQSLPYAQAVLKELAGVKGDSVEYMVRGINAELEAAKKKK